MILEPTVFVVDDDAAIRRSLRFLVESVGLKAETYETAEQFLAAYSPERPGCLVLDVRMPGMSGLHLQEELAARHLTLPVIIITGHGEVATAVIAMKKGAVDFIQKPVSDQMLLDAVRHAIDRDRRARDAAARRDVFESRLALLTPRERTVMDGVMAGKANKVIAGEMDIGEKTVESHRARMMKKLGVDSVAELVHLALASVRNAGKP